MRPATVPGPDAVRGLRVLAFCDYFSPTSCGGSERVAREVYRRLVASGASVTLVTATPNRPADRPSPTDAVDDDGIRVVRVPSLDVSHIVRGQASLAPALWSRLAPLARDMRPDVLHANGLYFQSSLAAAHLARRSRVPLVTTAHVAGRAGLRGPVRAATRLYDATLGRYVLRASARAIAVSHSVVDDLHGLGVPPDRIDVVCNGVDHAVFHPGPGSRASRRGPLHVVFVGRLIGNKGPQDLMEALGLCVRDGVDVRATFAGEGPLIGRLRGRAARLGVSAAFPGRVQDVPALLHRADVLARPSYTEGLPLAVLEAMACRVAVVASNIPGNADLIADGRTGLLHAPADIRGLAAKIAWAAANRGDLERLARAGHAESLRYSWDECARSTAAVLAGVASPVRRAVLPA